MGNLGVAQGNLGVNRDNSLSLAELRKAQAARPGAWNKNDHQIQLDVDNLLVKENKAIDAKYPRPPGETRPRKPRRAPPRQPPRKQR